MQNNYYRKRLYKIKQINTTMRLRFIKSELQILVDEDKLIKIFIKLTYEYI